MNRRLTILTFFLVSFGALIVVRAWASQAAPRMHVTNVRPTRRGMIFDRNGRALTVTGSVETAFIDPGRLPKTTDLRAVAAQLSGIVEIPAPSLYARVARKRARHVWLGRALTLLQADRLRALRLEGLVVRSEERRDYADRRLARHVLGSTDVDGTGIEGVELALDSRLSDPSVVVDTGPKTPSSQSGRRVAVGDDVTLTLDHDMQGTVERELERAVREFGASGGSAVLLDPRSGEVLAMASAPSFLAGAPEQVLPEQRRNRSITDVFEPGSTLKPFVLAGALARGVVAPNQIFAGERGRFHVYGRFIVDTHPADEFDLPSALVHSSNIVFAKIGLSMQAARVAGVLREFGFGKRTGVQLPGEACGLLSDPTRWYPIDSATIAFGQGLAVTTLQLAAAMGALANHGRWLQPTLIKGIRDARGVNRSMPAPEARQVVPAEIASLVTEMLVAVVERGTGTQAQVRGLRVAGKTGTGEQSARLRDGVPIWTSSFVGFAPAESPRVVLAIAIDDPMTAHAAGVVAAPAFARIMAQIAR